MDLRNWVTAGSTQSPSASNEAKKRNIGFSDVSDTPDSERKKAKTFHPSQSELTVVQSSKHLSNLDKDYFTDMRIAVSGVPTTLSRVDLEQYIVMHGGKLASSVSGKTSLLVIGHVLEDGRPVVEGSKYQTAKEKEVKIMTEQEFFAHYPPREPRRSAPQLQMRATTNNSVQTELWVDKYKPKSPMDLIGHAEVAKKLSDWLKSWNDIHILKRTKPAFSKENPGAKAVLLSGPPGIGKTSLATSVAQIMNFDVVELNASDTRNKSEIDNILIEAVSSKAITSNSWFTGASKPAVKSRLIIMDEVDGMGGSDRGGIAELIKIIKISKIPVICICNDRQSPKVRSLVNHCFDLKVKRPTKTQIASRLVQIASQEGLQIEHSTAEMLVEQSGNDIRQALNALQMWSCSANSSISYSEMKEGLGRIEKDKVLRQSPFDACQSILGGGKHGLAFEERYNSFFIDYSLVPLLVQQNYVDSAKSGVFRSPLDDVAKMDLLSSAADAVSDMDMVGSLIRGQDQHWELLPTQAIFSLKVGFAIQGFQSFPAFPAWLGKYSSTSKKSRLTKEIVHHTSLSIGQGYVPMRLDYIPFLKSALLTPLLRKGKEGVDEVIQILDFYGLSKEDFTETLKELQFKFEGDKVLVDAFEGIDSQTKAALTRNYNSTSHMSSTLVQPIAPKKSKKSASTEDFIDEDGEIIVDAIGEGQDQAEDEEEEDIAALRAQMSKSATKGRAKKPAANSTSTAASTKPKGKKK